MIVSHRHKVIFLKTGKTAGTSFEIALSSVCGPDDVVTPIVPEDEALRRSLGIAGPRNHLTPWRALPPKEFVRAALHRRTPQRYFNHITAEEARRLLPRAVWDGYYKFTIIRDPWDRTVSNYFWQTRNDAIRPSFHDFLLARPASILANWRIYTIDGRPVTDGVIRYEALDEGISRVSREAGLPANVLTLFKSLRAKGQHRDGSFAMTAADAALIGQLAEPEARTFGYDAPPARLVAGKRD